MINKTTWMQSILDSIRDIADLDFQKKAWLDFDENCVCSFEELISNLYDYSGLNKFIDQHIKKFYLTTEQEELLILLREGIDDFYYKPSIYYDALPPQIDENKVLVDPDWHEIRLIAQQVLDAFKDYKINEEDDIQINLN